MAYWTLMSQPFVFAAFIFLILSFISLWIRKRLWIWGSLYAVSLVCALVAGTMEFKTLVPIGFLFISHYFISQKLGYFWRFMAVMVAAIISFGFLGHLVAGFYNVPLVYRVQLSPLSVPYSLWINFDKPLIGLFALGFGIPLMHKRTDWKPFLLYSLAGSLLTICVLLGFNYSMHLAHFDPKVPAFTPLWLCINLFLVVIPEEAFFRGFLQAEITKGLPNKASPFLSILVVSLLFAGAHAVFVPYWTFILMAFIASVLYGTVYHLSQRVECCIATHYLFNVTHFFFFTYPALSALQ